MLNHESLDAVLLNAQHNFAWLSCGGTNGVDLSRENGAASLLVTRSGGRFLLANNIEMPRLLGEELSQKDFEPIGFTWQNEKLSGDFILETAKSVLATGAKLATDIPIAAAAPVIENKIALCRYELTPHELTRYRMLGLESGAAIGRVAYELYTGETEREIAETIRHKLGSKGITSIVTLVAADERISRFRHPVPTENRWEATLLLVTCAKRGGLCG